MSEVKHEPSLLNPPSSELKKFPVEGERRTLGSMTQWREGQKVFIQRRRTKVWRWLAGHVCSCGEQYHLVEE